MALKTTNVCHTDEEHARLGREQTLLDRIAELERRCADKDASIAQLIEQLQKAEAAVRDYDRELEFALSKLAGTPDRTEAEGAK